MRNWADAAYSLRNVLGVERVASTKKDLKSSKHLPDALRICNHSIFGFDVNCKVTF
jgi:hypothetical protein